MKSNILVIKSSPREKGNTNFLADQAARGAVDAGAEVHTIMLSQMSIKPCNACDLCQVMGEGCVIEDDMRALYPLFSAADGIVFTGPIYWFTINAQLKTCIDRLYAFEDGNGNALRGKKIGVILTYGDDDLYTSGGINAIHTFESIARYVRFKLVGIVHGQTTKDSSARKQPALIKKAYNLGLRIAAGE